MHIYSTEGLRVRD